MSPGVSSRNGTVLAAGVVLWRPGAAGIEVGVVHRPKYDDWSLPKGKLDPGEHLLACAVRETVEETGHRVSLSRPVGTISYPVGDITKEVHYWIARADDGAAPWPGTPEIDALEFLPLEPVLHKLTQGHDASLVAEAATQLGSPPVATTPVIVLRHGKATPRGSWSGDDAERPLDARGRGEAARLTLLLGCYGDLRVVSSPSRRCVETVRPYATAARTVVLTDPRLSEDGYKQDPKGAAALVRELLADDVPTVVCSHRPVLPALLTACGAPKPSRPLRPGAFVVVHHHGGAVAASERHTS